MSAVFFRKVVLLGICGVLALLCGCNRQDKRADLVIINGAEPETIDPPLLTGQPEDRVAKCLFEGLTRYNEKGEIIPGIAKSWEVSADGKKYLFHLRSSYWSDGKPLTAHDFVESWKRTLSPSTGAIYSYQLYTLENGEAYSKSKITDFSQVGAKAIDDFTLEVKLENPVPYFLELCAASPLAPVPVDVINKYGGNWTKPESIVSNGAFVLDQWRLNDRIRLRKNPLYWDAVNVRLRTVDLLPINMANTALNFYYARQADVLLDKGLISPLYIDALKNKPDYHPAPFLGSYFLAYNCTRPPFNDARVRRAFSLVINKGRITQNITRAGEKPATGIVPAGIAGYPGIQGLPYNPEEARLLLAKSGYPAGKGLPLIEFLYNSSAANEGIAVELQDEWRRQLGVTVNLTQQEWKVYLNSVTALNFGIARRSWVGDYGDPNTFLDMFTTGNGNNGTGWTSPQYDHWIAQAMKEPNPQKRFKILAQAEDFLVNKEAVICPIYTFVGILFFDDSRVGGLGANLRDEHPLRTMYRKDL